MVAHIAPAEFVDGFSHYSNAGCNFSFIGCFQAFGIPSCKFCASFRVAKFNSATVGENLFHRIYDLHNMAARVSIEKPVQFLCVFCNRVEEVA